MCLFSLGRYLSKLRYSCWLALNPESWYTVGRFGSMASVSMYNIKMVNLSENKDPGKLLQLMTNFTYELVFKEKKGCIIDSREDQILRRQKRRIKFERNLFFIHMSGRGETTKK